MDTQQQIRPSSGWKKLAMIAAAWPLLALPACTAQAGLAMRDAAISGAASFVQSATTQVLTNMFAPAEQ